MKRSIIFCFFAAFGGFTFGYDIGYISGCLIMPNFIHQMAGPNATELSAKDQSVITALLSAGTFFGAIGQAFTSDRLGRRGSIMFWSVIFSIGVIIQTSSFGIPQLAVGRLIAGLGVGAMSAIVPLYIGEAAPKKLRGTLLVLYQVQIITGLFIAYMVNLGTHHLTDSAASWRVPIGLQLAWGIFLVSGAFFLPESPRLLLGQGHEDKALTAIARLNDCGRDDPLAREVMAEMHEAITEENKDGKAGWLEVFGWKNAMFKRTLNGMMVQFFQQLNGQNFYYYYGPVFFQKAGTSLDSYSIQAILGGVSLVMVIPALWTIENVGRRKSLLIGALIEAACAAIAGFVGHYYTDDPSAPQSKQTLGGNVLIAFAIIHVSSYSMFWGPTPWVLLGETFPLRVRPKCIALGSATNWFWNFMLSYFSPYIVDDIGSYILLIFFGCLLAAFVYVFLMIPETKGITLEEVDELYRSGTPAWRSHSWTPSGHRGVADSTGETRRFSEHTAVGNGKDGKVEGDATVAHNETTRGNSGITA